MSTTMLVSQLNQTSQKEIIAQRFRELCLTLLEVDHEGGVVAVGLHGGFQIEEALVQSPLFRNLIVPHVQVWHRTEQRCPVELFGGCWLLPLDQQAPSASTHRVAVMIDRTIVQSEAFCHICDQAELDRQVMTQVVQREVPVTVDQAQAERTQQMLQWMEKDLVLQKEKQMEVDQMSVRLGDTYEELNLLYRLSERMVGNERPQAFLHEATSHIRHVTNLTWLAVGLIDQDNRLGALQGYLAVDGQLPCHPTRLSTLVRELMAQLPSEQPLIIDHENFEHFGTTTSLIGQQMLAVPIHHQDKPVAIILGADKKNHGQMTTVDTKLVQSAAQSMNIFIENLMLYEDVQDMFMGTLRSLVSAIDAKDSYTCGHSERVAWGSRALAEMMGLAPEVIDQIYLSALVHDVGKIGIPEAVLCKPGQLTNDEFAMIKTHPEMGVRILKDIRQMEALLPGVLHHHERWDGRGYPYNLSGEDIPLFGRVIALADSFDAMSSSRTYRCAMQHEKVIEEILNCAGMQFDPKLAELFVKIDFEPFYQMIEEHQERQSPLSLILESYLDTQSA